MDAALHETRHLPARPGEQVEIACTFPGDARRGGALLCSPQPHLGGDLDNNVLRALARALANAGLPVLRFNYRSVGGSCAALPGVQRWEYWKGVAERGEHGRVLEDAAEAYERAARLFVPALLGGYSFGAYVALRLAERLALDLPLVLVAPPLGRLDFRALGARANPCLLVLAEKDALDPAPARDELSRLYPGARVALLDGADHFFLGREEACAAAVLDFLGETGWLERFT
ncbi:MAG: hypothetical protein HY812_13620 [Planctomycetes bacterium]|nr:hypothetical protein [Planctomycetota bacterium]